MTIDELQPADARAEGAGARQEPSHGRRPRDRGPHPDRPKRRVVNGWCVLDKPVGMTSTYAVALVKRALNAKKAGHAGTLDPLASGILPIALGEATKTVPYVMDGRKAYVFTVAWGVETDTDDAEGKPVQATNRTPSREEVEAQLPRFTGTIEQVPPRYSAVKIAGERAYDLARDGEVVELKPRVVEVDRLEVMAHDGERTILRAECGKGTYVRALARDIGRAIGCLGHVSALRRTRVGPFEEGNAVSVGDLQEAGASGEVPPGLLQPVAIALCDLEAVAVSRDAAGRLLRGQPAILRGRDAPIEGRVYATYNGALVAVGDVEKGEFLPHRVFSLGG
ncbi:tRNA pseudouridine(55) synthase TruB [Enterovirga sp.]|uniref:tRNA pseudouridine(55) synthase TruB n=1 Tax=Enterovirga sp. TaxID=2026350 RepID=UPI002CAF0620|nr:tRNA pseudouridine(55) synthase TruB [Enterovirga sp.]HMO29332.1 tRNA pseudouridine(55) synthase TruB [Enterovirga sp.]